MKKLLSVLLIVLSISAMAQNTLPDPPKFQSASVLPETSPTAVRLTWLQSDSLDVAGYIVYKIVDNITTTLDTVIGRETTAYEYSSSSANAGSERYRLAAYDTEGFKSSITSPHSTIYLKTAYDKCEHKATLTWSEYVGWEYNIANYRVYRRFTGTDYQLIKTLPSTTTEFVDENLVNGRWYCYYIEAVRNDGITATSNSISLTASGHEGPLSIKANYANVDENQNITLSFQITNSGEVVEFQLLRSTSIDGEYNSIASFPFTGQTQIVYTDSDVDASQYIYYYKLASIDPCGQTSKTSNIASNILLKAESTDATYHELEWSDYKEWPGGVFNYKIYSYFDGVTTELGSNGPGSLDFENDISAYVKKCHDKGIYLTNTFCYFVEAYENSSDGTQNYSRSNLACVYEAPIVWVPTAFNITSKEEVNRTFKPVMSFVKDFPYEFIIYDRWGQQVFKTTNVQEGWSGKDAKTYYHTDYYIYKIKYADYKDKEYSKTGTFFLLME